jgi:hypothetical protein
MLTFTLHSKVVLSPATQGCQPFVTVSIHALHAFGYPSAYSADNSLPLCFCALHVGSSPVQSQVLGMYVLQGSMSSCGAPQLLMQLDDAISDAMGETRQHCTCSAFPSCATAAAPAAGCAMHCLAARRLLHQQLDDAISNALPSTFAAWCQSS